MSEEIKKPRKPATTVYVARRNLCTYKGVMVTKGNKFACTEKEAEHFKASGAI